MNEGSADWMFMPYFDDYVEGILVKIGYRKPCDSKKCSYNIDKDCVHRTDKWKICTQRLGVIEHE